MYIKPFFSIAALSAVCLHAMAQKPSGNTRSSKPTIYLLPDGRILPPEKLDSLSKAWGTFSIQHDTADDAKGVVHLVRMTDEIKQQTTDQATKSKQAFAAMLNKPAPDFVLKDLQGNRLSLQELRGKVVVLNFWFTSCAPCIREMPELNQLVRDYDSSKVVFLGLTYNNVEQVRTFLKRYNFSYTLLPESDEVDKKYQVSSWPTSVVIDKAGYVKMIIHSGPKIREELEAVINAL